VPPAESPALVHGLERHALIALGTEDKLLPGSVIKDAAAEHAAAWEKSHGLKPGRKLMRDFKDRATTELLPRAFVRRRSTRAWIDPVKRRLIVDAASAARAEALTETLRETLGELKIVVPTATHAPADVMTGWLRAQQAPGRFELGEDCELTGSDPSKPVVRYVRHPLVAAQLRRHFDDGFRASRLSLTWNNRLSLMVDDALQVRRLRFLDIDEAGGDGGELSAQDRFDAEFALMTHDVAALLDDLHEAFTVTADPEAAR
jgi:DNA recombination-dependent growth factor C